MPAQDKHVNNANNADMCNYIITGPFHILLAGQICLTHCVLEKEILWKNYNLAFLVFLFPSRSDQPSTDRGVACIRSAEAPHKLFSPNNCNLEGSD